MQLKPVMRMRWKRVWWIWDRLRRAWWRGLASGANEADFRPDFLEQILGQIIWGAGILLKPISGRSPTLGNEAQSRPSSEVVSEWDQNGAIGPLGDNKGRVDTWAQKWDKNATKKGGQKIGRATIWWLNGANSWCRRIYNEDPRHLCHINHPQPSLCFSVFKGKMRRPLFLFHFIRRHQRFARSI